MTRATFLFFLQIMRRDSFSSNSEKKLDRDLYIGSQTKYAEKRKRYISFYTNIDKSLAAGDESDYAITSWLS